MTANTAYDIFKTLPYEEQFRLIVLVNEQYPKGATTTVKKEKKKPVLSTEQAQLYLFKNIFSKK